jgi:hypothetical protein
MIYEQTFFLTGHPMSIELTLAHSSTNAINVLIVMNNLLDCFTTLTWISPLFSHSSPLLCLHSCY